MSITDGPYGAHIVLSKITFVPNGATGTSGNVEIRGGKVKCEYREFGTTDNKLTEKKDDITLVRIDANDFGLAREIIIYDKDKKFSKTYILQNGHVSEKVNGKEMKSIVYQPAVEDTNGNGKADCDEPQVNIWLYYKSLGTGLDNLEKVEIIRD